MPGSQPPIYRPRNRRQAKQPQPHPRATARVPTPHHATPALTKTTKKDELFRVFVRAGVVRTRGGDPCGRPGGWGGGIPLLYMALPGRCVVYSRGVPLRSPWGGVVAYLAVALAMIPALAPCPCGRPGVGHSPPAQHAHLTPIGRGLSPPLGLITRYTQNSAYSFAPHSPYPRKSS